MCVIIDRALLDPYLPRFYRTYYSALRAWHSEEDEGARLLQDAKDGVKDMRQVMEAEGRSQQYIDDYVANLERLIGSVEYDLANASEE